MSFNEDEIVLNCENKDQENRDERSSESSVYLKVRRDVRRLIYAVQKRARTTFEPHSEFILLQMKHAALPLAQSAERN